MPARPPVVTKRLSLWWVLAAGVLVALGFAATDHMLRATVAFAGSLAVAAAIRALAPDERAGGLVVRRRHMDVAMLLVLAVAVALVGFSLDLTAQV